MIRYRSFRNSDPPAIAETWHSHPPLRGLVQYVSPAVLDRHALSKPYFDRDGLIVAADGERIAGFVHAGFGAAAQRDRIERRRGVVSLLLMAPRKDREAIAAELLQRAEGYLQARGAKQVTASGVPGDDPFYLGVLGGSELPGVLESDAVSLSRFRGAGYSERGRRLVLHRKLAGFRPPVDRQQMKVRRAYNVGAIEDPPADDWWSACVWGEALVTRYNVRERGNNETRAQVDAWDMQPLASGWGVNAAGLAGLRVDDDIRRQGVATFLVGETLRRLQSQKVALVETQIDAEDVGGAAFFSKLGFEQADEGVVLIKEL